MRCCTCRPHRPVGRSIWCRGLRSRMKDANAAAPRFARRPLVPGRYPRKPVTRWTKVAAGRQADGLTQENGADAGRSPQAVAAGWSTRFACRTACWRGLIPPQRPSAARPCRCGQAGYWSALGDAGTFSMATSRCATATSRPMSVAEFRTSSSPAAMAIAAMSQPKIDLRPPCRVRAPAKTASILRHREPARRIDWAEMPADRAAGDDFAPSAGDRDVLSSCCPRHRIACGFVLLRASSATALSEGALVQAS